jgi:hypothetical protein
MTSTTHKSGSKPSSSWQDWRWTVQADRTRCTETCIPIKHHTQARRPNRLSCTTTAVVVSDAMRASTRLLLPRISTELACIVIHISQQPQANRVHIRQEVQVVQILVVLNDQSPAHQTQLAEHREQRGIKLRQVAQHKTAHLQSLSDSTSSNAPASVQFS